MNGERRLSGVGGFMCLHVSRAFLGRAGPRGSHPELVTTLLCDVGQVLRPQSLVSAARVFPNIKSRELGDGSRLVGAPWTHGERGYKNASSQTPASLIQQLLA